MGRIVQRLAEEAGIDPASLEASRITWTIQRRCRQLGIATDGDYVALLQVVTRELERPDRCPRDSGDPLLSRPAGVRYSSSLGPGDGDELPGPAARSCRRPAVPARRRIRWRRYCIVRACRLARFRSMHSISRHRRLRLLNGAFIPRERWKRFQSSYRPRAARCAIPALAHARGTAPVASDSTAGTWRARTRSMSNAGYHLILCRNLFIYLHAQARAVLADR